MIIQSPPSISTYPQLSQASYDLRFKLVPRALTPNKDNMLIGNKR